MKGKGQEAKKVVENQHEADYTLRLASAKNHTVHTVRFSKWAVRFLGAGAVAFVALSLASFSYVTYAFYAQHKDRTEMQGLREVNEMQQEQLLNLSKKADALQGELDALTKAEQELRQVAGEGDAAEDNTQPAENAQAQKGQGGPGVAPTLHNVGQALDDLEKRIAVRKESLAQLQEALKAQREALGNAPNFSVSLGATTTSIPYVTPSIWPAPGDVSSPFGMRWGGTDFHPGIDIANDYGTPIRATADGTVTFAGPNAGYGNMVDIDHGSGIVTRYGHAQTLAVRAGQKVKRGQVIAYMGSTGFSTGPHVHYEVRVNGSPVNPIGYL